MLGRIQNELERIYGISCSECVEDFLLTETTPSSILPIHPWIHHTEEALLVEQSEDNLDVGLWVKPNLLEWSGQQSWEELWEKDLSEDTLQKMGPLIEGVSHFVYLLWKAGRDHCVTQLELELQAEVDKFILFSSGWGKHQSRKVMQILFEEARWIPQLSDGEKERYHTAVKFASQYCESLRENYLNHSAEELLPELRSFYRMGQSEKIWHIRH